MKGAASFGNGKDDEAESHRGDGIPHHEPSVGDAGTEEAEGPLSEANASLQNHC